MVNKLQIIHLIFKGVKWHYSFLLIDPSDQKVIEQKNIFFSNTIHFIQLNLLEDCYKLPENVKINFLNIEKCFCEAFDLVTRLFIR